MIRHAANAILILRPDAGRLLGAEVIVSGPTTCAALHDATSRATADLCFPAKVYVVRLLALAGEVDLLFVPSLRRPVPAATHCAKIIGLPDLARAVLPDPSKLLEIDVDLDRARLALAQAVWAAGRQPRVWLVTLTFHTTSIQTRAYCGG